MTRTRHPAAWRIVLAALAVMACGPHAARAEQGAIHRMVIQVSSADPASHRIALNNAVNLRQALAPGAVEIEIVAYGPGVAMLAAEGPESLRIAELAGEGVAFSACGNTLAAIEAERGEKLPLAAGVNVVPAGVLRIMELQEQGYTYLRP